jgi:truncated hemoglobin YjbI
LQQHDDYDRTMESASLLRAIGGGRRILELTTRFYAMAFEDQQLREFFFAGDGAAAHGDRLGHWLIQFMGGEGNPWDDSGREGMRQPSHAKAWFSSKRPAERRGRRFKLDDCRVWMRLMFWSARQVGLFPSSESVEVPTDSTDPISNDSALPLSIQRAFEAWFVSFISHFIRIYEFTAPPYAQRDAVWSLNAANIQRYYADQRAMRDVMGVLRG